MNEKAGTGYDGYVDDTVLFTAKKFSIEPPVEKGVSYNLPLGDDIESRWGIQFYRPRGCLGLFLGRPDPRECRWAQTMVAQILSEDPKTFQDVQWLDQAEYDLRH